MLVAVQYLSCLRAHGHWAEGGLENSLQPKFTALRPFDHDENIFMRIPSAKTKEHAFDEESFLFFQNATNWWVTK